jgi:hypothetical protein
MGGVLLERNTGSGWFRGVGKIILWHRGAIPGWIFRQGVVVLVVSGGVALDLKWLESKERRMEVESWL